MIASGSHIQEHLWSAWFLVMPQISKPGLLWERALQSYTPVQKDYFWWQTGNYTSLLKLLEGKKSFRIKVPPQCKCFSLTQKKVLISPQSGWLFQRSFGDKIPKYKAAHSLWNGNFYQTMPFVVECGREGAPAFSHPCFQNSHKFWRI